MPKKKIAANLQPPASPSRLLTTQEVMRHLHEEHKYISRLLYVLQEQLELIEAGEMPDLTVMHDTASYMQDHADHSHHAKEDIIYRKLSECGDEQKAAAVTLLMDHETISKKSEALVRSINEAQLELSKDNQKMLHLRCEDYIASMRKHMDYEESQVFPLVLESLSAEDWADIIQDIQPDADPLFGSTIEQRYVHLLEAVNRVMERAAEDVAMAELVGLGAAMENFGVFSRFGNAMAKTISLHFKQAYAGNMAACRKLWQARSTNIGDYGSVTVDCLLNNYDACVDTLKDIGQLLRSARTQIAEPYTARLRIYHEMTRPPAPSVRKRKNTPTVEK
ncbi:MAG: hemerythrin domain-containing protein [Cellvibrionales bacterium]|nr:hemerythrin domain-containing protein [Cellvibrionales bacterium]